MQVDPTILTLTGELLVIFVMLMGLMLRILRRMDKINEKVEANTVVINSLAVQIDTRTAELDAKIDTRTAELSAKIDTRTAELSAKIDTRTAELSAKIDTRTAELDAKIDTRTAELDAKIDTRAAQSDAKVNSLAAAILAGFEVCRERIDLNRERIDDNRSRIDSFVAYLREFRIETRENFDLLRARIEKLDDQPGDGR